MEFIEQAQYQLWAEKKFFELLKQVSNESWTKKFPEFNNKSLKSIYIHKYETIFSWFTLIHVKNSKNINDNPLDIPDFDELSKDEFINAAIKLFEMMNDYIKKNKNTEITLTVEWLQEPYLVTTHEVLYNLLNHMAYHRGQTAFMFKKFGFNTPETDYNPYIYSIRNLKE